MPVFFNLSILNEKEIEFYNFVKENLNDVFNKTVQELSREYGCGISFIYNLFNKLKIDGIKTFVYKLGFQNGYIYSISSAANQILNQKVVDTIEDVNIIFKNSLTENLNKLLVNYNRCINSNAVLLGEQFSKLKLITNKLLKSKKIYGFGQGYAELPLLDLFSFLNKWDLKTKQIIKSSININKTIAKIDKSDLVFVYSFFGKSQYTESIIKRIKEARHDVFIILITTNAQSRFIKKVDLSIWINNDNLREQDLLKKPVLFSPAISLMFFNDVLKNQIYSINNKEFNKKENFIKEIESWRQNKNMLEKNIQK